MIKPANKEESRVYFLKMIGDYCRYKTETLEFKPEQKEKVCNEATKCYEDANAVNLGPCSATRLGLILNMSVFYYETCKEHKKARAIGESALTVALEKVDDLAEAEFQEAKPLIEQLKENLQAWKDEEAAERARQELL